MTDHVTTMYGSLTRANWTFTSGRRADSATGHFDQWCKGCFIRLDRNISLADQVSLCPHRLDQLIFMIYSIFLCCEPSANDLASASPPSRLSSEHETGQIRKSLYFIRVVRTHADPRHDPSRF